MEFVTMFAAISGAIYVAMEILKKIVPEQKFKRLAPFIPIAIGACVGFFAFSEMNNPTLQVCLGLLAGSLSVNSYEMIKSMVKREG